MGLGSHLVRSQTFIKKQNSALQILIFFQILIALGFSELGFSSPARDSGVDLAAFCAQQMEGIFPRSSQGARSNVDPSTAEVSMHKSWVWTQPLRELNVDPEADLDTSAVAISAQLIAKLSATLILADRDEPLDSVVWARIQRKLQQFFMTRSAQPLTLDMRVLFPRGKNLHDARPFELRIRSVGTTNLQFVLTPKANFGTTQLWDVTFRTEFERIWDRLTETEAVATRSLLPNIAANEEAVAFARKLAIAFREDRIIDFVNEVPGGRDLSLSDLTAILVDGIAAQSALENDQIPGAGKVNSRRIGQWFTKFYRRALDVSASTVGLIATGPVIGLLALAIKWDSPGPVVYKQPRCRTRCVNGVEHVELYTMPKLRSMRDRAEDDGKGERLAATDDDRITRVGRFMRRTRADELPQLWSILKGEMTLIGHRPEREKLLATLVQTIPYFEQRGLGGVKPGATGMAQTRLDYLGMPRPYTQLERFLGEKVPGFDELRSNVNAPAAQEFAMSIKLLHDLADRMMSANFSDRVITDVLIVVRTFGVMFGRLGR